MEPGAPISPCGPGGPYKKKNWRINNGVKNNNEMFNINSLL